MRGRGAQLPTNTVGPKLFLWVSGYTFRPHQYKFGPFAPWTFHFQFPDYLEADIDSTDTLVPSLNELFGQQLLLQRFLLADAGTPPIRRPVHVVQFSPIEDDRESVRVIRWVISAPSGTHSRAPDRSFFTRTLFPRTPFPSPWVSLRPGSFTLDLISSRVVLIRHLCPFVPRSPAWSPSPGPVPVRIPSTR